MIGPLITAGATLLGGYLAQRSQSRREDTQIQRRVADARAAGVHPIAALGANTGAGPSASIFGDAVARSGQAIGNGLSKSLDTDARAVKTLLLEKAGLENELLRTQITRAKQEDIMNPQGAARSAINGQKSVMLPDAPPGVALSKVEDPTFTPSYHVGKAWKSNPHFSDAQTIQNRHGEWAEGAYGAISIPADIYYNWTQGLYGNVSWRSLTNRLANRDVRSRQERQR